MNWTEERDKDGNPTPLAIAAKALEENGCDCDADCDEVHTCLAGLCEVALFDERNKLEVAEQTNSSLRAENERLRKALTQVAEEEPECSADGGRDTCDKWKRIARKALDGE